MWRYEDVPGIAGIVTSFSTTRQRQLVLARPAARRASRRLVPEAQPVAAA
jgi:hypothetical protein